MLKIGDVVKVRDAKAGRPTKYTLKEMSDEFATVVDKKGVSHVIDIGKVVPYYNQPHVDFPEDDVPWDERNPY